MVLKNLQREEKGDIPKSVVASMVGRARPEMWTLAMKLDNF